MDTQESYIKILKSISLFQYNIALILEAKAVEASRSSQWLCHHLVSSRFENHNDQLKRTLEIHDQLLEVIDGLTKMETALTKNMQALLGEPENNETGGNTAEMIPFRGN